MLDFGSLLATLLVLQLLQAAGFAFVYRAYRPRASQARYWAAGSALIGAGAFLVLLRDVAPPAVSVLAGNFAFYAGILIFDAGIVRACGASVPGRWALGLILAAAAAQTWFALVEPSISARVWILSGVLTACNGYTLMVAWRSRGPARGILRLVALLLAVEIGFSILRALMTQGALVHVLQSTPGQTWPLLGMIATRFVLTLVLALLMSERIQAELRHAAMHDPLTGLLNRRAFAEIAEREWSRLRRHGGTAVALMIDLDEFKRFNDRNGHAAGDEALREAARAIVGEMRREDHCCRYGGEEFAVLLPGTSSAQALGIAERLRGRIAASVPLSHAQVRVTASIGLAQSAAREGAWETLLEAADRALYEAKSRGRNCVVVFAPNQVPARA